MQLALLFFTLFHLFFISRFNYVLPILPIVYAVAIRSQKALIGWWRLRLRGQA